MKRTFWDFDWSLELPEGVYDEGTDHRWRTSEQDASLVASLTENGLHAPALDIDWRVSHLTNGMSHRLLIAAGTAEKPCRYADPEDWREFLRASLEAGLIERKTFEDEFSYFAMRTEPIDHHEIRFDVPVIVLPSTSPGHFHIYIEKEMAWPVYLRLLQAMMKIGFLEFGFVAAAERREMTMLVKPGMKNPRKTEDEHIDVSGHKEPIAESDHANPF